MDCQNINTTSMPIINAFETMLKLKLKESSICVRTIFYLFVFEAAF